jgi:gentisate 1,2-dioxygenase
MAVETTAPASVEQFVENLRAAGLDAPWTRPGPLIPPKATAVQSRHWRWAQIEPLVRQGPEFMKPGRGAERRILRLDNPGVPERTATHTISVAVQYLLPGEVAPAHRHTPNAVRFMLHGEGAFTTVEGDKCVMRRVTS